MANAPVYRHIVVTGPPGSISILFVSDVTKHRTVRTAKYRSWVLVKCVWTPVRFRNQRVIGKVNFSCQLNIGALTVTTTQTWGWG